MAINTIPATILMRGGLEREFNPDKMTPREWAVSTDAKYVRMCFAPGVVVRMATYEGFEADMVQVQEILEECQDIQTAVDAVADLAEQHKNAAAASAKLSESWAKGGTGVRPGENTNNSQFFAGLAETLTAEAEKLLDQAQKVIVAATQGALIPGGTVTFENLPTNPATGYMYNISNDFTTDSRFVEGAGVFYRAGANVYWTADGKWDVLVGTQVTGVKGAKETTYHVGNVSLSAANVGAVAIEDVDAALSTTSVNPVQNKAIANSTLSLTTFIEIPSGADLKSAAYLTPGNYACTDSTANISATLVNCPIKGAFTLEVRYSNGTSGCIEQVFRSYKGDKIVSRVRLSSGTFTNLVTYLPVANNLTTATPGTGALDAYQGKVLDDKFKTVKSLTDFTEIPSGADLKSAAYLVPGNYCCKTLGVAETLINCPTNESFTMSVSYANGTNDYIKQTFYNYLGKYHIERLYAIRNSSWYTEYTYLPTANNLTTSSPGDYALDAYQ